MPQQIKALSLWQPYAQLIALGYKRFETRHWQTPHRGLLAIHAAKRWTRAEQVLLQLPMFRDSLIQPNGLFNLPLGKVVCICELEYCHLMTPLFIAGQTDKERAFGHWEAGRYAWELKVLKVLDDPISLTGRQGLFKWTMPADLAKAVEEAQQVQRAEEQRRHEELGVGVYGGIKGYVHIYIDDGGLW